MPGYSVSIKERMLYSSCKNSVVDVLEKIYNIPIEKKVEVDTGAELTEEYLMVTLIHKIFQIIILYRVSYILSRTCTNPSFLSLLHQAEELED